MTHNAPAPKAQSLGTLFFTFFKIGLFTFGGGYAMIALLEEEFIQRRRWLDKDEFLDMTAIADVIIFDAMLEIFRGGKVVKRDTKKSELKSFEVAQKMCIRDSYRTAS